MTKPEKLFELMEKLSEKVFKTSQLREYSPVEYFRFIEKGKPSRTRHFDIKTFNNFDTHSSEFDKFFLTKEHRVFPQTINISKVFPVRSDIDGMSFLRNIKLCDTSPVTETLQSDLTFVPLLPLAAGLVLQYYLENPSCNVDITPYIGTLYNWPLLIDKFPMYKIYDDIYLILDGELIDRGYTFRQRGLVQYEFARSLSKVVAVDNDSSSISNLISPGKFIIDKVSLNKNL